MPRGFKRDNAATKIARGLGELRDRRSFISLPKQTHGDIQGHKILYGQDKSAVRAEIFRNNQEVHEGVNRCDNCGNRVTWETGEWHHLLHKAGERCDCPQNGAVWCFDCHRGEHVQVQFTKAEA